MLKGQLDKAIKDYQQVVVLDPKEVRHRQRLAELLVRDNRRSEAIVQYEDIGKHYADNSYFLKAIAVYKQIQRLIPEDTAISLTLASLNQRQGLTGNALAEYGQVVAQFEKEGNLKETVKVLEQMLAIDGVPAATRLKYAELLFATGEVDQSHEVFSAYLTSLRDAGDGATVQRLAGRMRELFPDRPEAGPSGAPPPTAEMPGRALAAAEVAPEPVAAKPPAMPIEPPSAFGPTTTIFAPAADFDAQASSFDFATPFEIPSEFETPVTSEVPGNAPAVQKSQAPEPGLPWEEEIELDLDLDLDDDPAVTVPSVPDMDLSLDFSLSLDFDETEHFAPVSPKSMQPPAGESDLSPFAELPEVMGTSPDTGGGAAGSTLEEGGSLELDWPEEIDISLDDEPDLDAAALAKGAEAAQAMKAAKASQVAQVAAAAQAAEAAEQAQSQARQLRGWQEIFPESEPATDVAMDLDELESHYDLGIAYKEMGLYGDAIKEFTVAAGNPRRRLDCLTLQAICYREWGEPGNAEELLQRGLSLEVLSAEERMSLSYELAFLFETTGGLDEAISLYREVHGINPSFHDVANRLSTLVGEEPLDIIDLELEEEEDF